MSDFTKGPETFSLGDASLEGRLRAWAALHVSTGNERSRTHALCVEAADALAEQAAVLALLVEALKDTLSFVESDYQFGSVESPDGTHIMACARESWVRARAALAKATGAP